MQINSLKVEYALRALVELASCEGCRQARDLASEWDIPHAYLDRLLITLRNAGLLYSLRGPQGGHGLLKAACEMTVLDVWEALEGPLASDPFWGYGHFSAAERSVLPAVWGEITAGISDLLRSITIEELVRRQNQLGRSQAS